MYLFSEEALHDTWSYPFKISSLPVSKSALNYGFDNFYWRDIQRKLHCEATISIIYRLKIRKPLILCWDWIILISKIKIWKIWKFFENFWKFWSSSSNFENMRYLDELSKFCSNSLVTEILNTKLNLFFIAFMRFLCPWVLQEDTSWKETMITFTEFSRM